MGAHEDTFNLCHQAALSWLGIPRETKVIAGDAAAAITGGAWTTSALSWNGCCLEALTTSAAGSSLRFTLSSSGSAAYLWYQLQPMLDGVFTVCVDGGAPSAPISTRYSTVSNLVSYGVLRLPVSAGTHTFDVVAVGGTVGVLGVGSARSSAPLPTVLASEVPPNANQSSSDIAEYSADAQSNVTQLRADGIDVRYVPLSAFFTATPANTIDGALPTAAGAAEIAQAFADALGSSAEYLNDSTSLAAASLTLASLGAGKHQVDMHYSGDSRYAAADAASQVFSIYDGSATIDLNPSSTTISQGTPLTLTASVADASGEVEFYEGTSAGNVLLGAAWLGVNAAGSAAFTLPGLTGGQHTFMAIYRGDSRFDGCSSATVSVSVTGPATMTSLSAPATRFSFGDPVSLTASVSPASATGSVSFLDSGVLLGQAILSGGNASFSTSALSTGIHHLTGSYSGSSTENSSVSPELSLEIDSGSSTVVLGPLASPLAYGTRLALLATVSPAAATGSVTFLDRFIASGQPAATAVTLGETAVSGGNSTLALPDLLPGTHSISALYNGDGDYLPATSSTHSTLVTVLSSTLTLTAAASEVAFATPVALSASVTPASAGGTVTVADLDSGASATAALLNGAANVSIPHLSPGVHTFSATYSGSAYVGASASGPVIATVDRAVSSVTLLPLPASVASGTSITLTALVSPAAATGSVVFEDALRGVLGQAQASSGSATLTLQNLSAGSYSISAVYSGDANDAKSVSEPLTTTVALDASTISLGSSNASATLGGTVTLIATLTPSAATGIVTFLDGGATLGASAVAGGRATLGLTFNSAGVHTLTALYSGDSISAPASSVFFPQTILRVQTWTSLALTQNNIVAGSDATVNVQVRSAAGTPSGTIALRRGGTVLAQSPVANASNSLGYATLTFSSSVVGFGTIPLTAFYSGDTNDLPSDTSSSPTPLTIVSIPDAVSLSVSAQQLPINQPITLTASLSSPSATPLTGTVTFESNGNTLATLPVSSAGTVTFAWTPPAAGVYALTANFVPSGFFTATSAPPVVVAITLPLAASASPATLSAVPGGSGIAHLVLTPLSGFTGAISTSCQTSAPFLSCVIHAPSALTSASPVSVPVEVIVAQSVAAASLPHQGWANAIPAGLLACLLPFALRGNRDRTCRVTLLCGVLFTLVAMGGCASAGNFNAVPTGLQTVQIAVTAGGVVTSTSFTVNVGN